MVTHCHAYAQQTNKHTHTQTNKQTNKRTQGGIASVPAAAKTAAKTATELAAAEMAGLQAQEEAKAATEEEEAFEGQEEDAVVLAAAAPVDADEEEVAAAAKTLSPNVGGVLLGLCGLAAFLACAVLLSHLVVARSTSTGDAAGPRFALPPLPAALGRFLRRADYETVAEEQEPAVIAGIRV